MAALPQVLLPEDVYKRQFLRWMGTPADVLKNSVLYFRIYFLGSIAFVLYNIFVGILQSCLLYTSVLHD